MNSLLDDFEGLLSDGDIKDPSNTSKEYITKYKDFQKNNQVTYSGVYKDSILKCMSIEDSVDMPWEHTCLTLDVSVLRDISKPRLSHFNIPPFIDELRSIGDKNNSGFGFNEYGRNHVKNIVIPPSIFAIASNTFAFYRKLESISFPEESRLSILGDSAFAFCEELIEVDLSKCKYLKELPSKLFDGSAVKKLKINGAIRKIAQDTFDNCSISAIFIDEYKYTFNSFIERLISNDYNAFWV